MEGEFNKRTEREKITIEIVLTQEQYKTISKWFERAGLLFLGSLVVQNLLGGAPFDSQVVFAGVVASVVAYLAAFLLLTKS